ncbi:MAG: glycoside hydrolase family 2 TIM barrel-domain containing protein [Verrucomicrobiae bacterium]|nr:glycoside hydrolase family 2 TIM barrel-domain containing protein [Verrucomicrobiae bacterium]
MPLNQVWRDGWTHRRAGFWPDEPEKSLIRNRCRELAAHVRQEDSSRLISYAALYGNVGPLADIVDVLGVNSYYGWYDKIWGGKGLQAGTGTPKEPPVEREPIDLAQMRAMLDKILAQKTDLALLLTEFGADSVPGFLSKTRDLWSENYHADLLNAIFQLAKNRPQITGTFPFCFSDYRDPSKSPNGYWNELNLKGVVDCNRNRKMAFNTVAKEYHRPAQAKNTLPKSKRNHPEF